MTWEYFNITGYDSYARRLLEAGGRVQTPYVCLLDDQETIFVSGIAKAIDHLETHPDQSCAGGRVASAVSIGGRIRLIPYEGWSSYWSLDDDDPITRFRALASHERTANLYYQVIRTEDLRNIVSGLESLCIDYSSALEIHLAGCLAMSGKWEMGDYPYWVRSGGSLKRPATEHAHLAWHDARDICVRLLQVRGTDEGVSQDSATQNNEMEEVLNQILAVWGERDRGGQRQGLASMIGRSTEYPKKRLGRVLRNRAPAAYRLLRKDRDPDLSFSEYALAHGSGSHVAMLDMLRTETIWQEFPHGITESNFKRLIGVT